MKLVASLFLIFVSFEVYASGFLPKSDRKIPLRTDKYFSLTPSKGGITEEQFNQVADTIQNLYSEQVKAQGGKLVFKKDWNEPEVNCYAERDGKNWIVKLFGGLARYPELTVDGFALIVCHEMGHHIGGAVKNPNLNTWSTCEGSSDYFAASKCFKKYAELVPASKFDDSELESTARESCHRVYSTSKEREICKRTAMAGKAAIKTVENETAANISFDTPDLSEVGYVRVTHADPQCRIDTLLAGALCNVENDAPVDNKDYHVGTCTALTHTEGLRPRCWFRPQE